MKAICLHCSVEFTYGVQKTGKYCSNTCTGAAKRAESRERFERGEIFERSTNKIYVIERDGYICADCGISDYNGKPIKLQLDHIDGCAGNNMPANLQLLCPNCHSQTDHFGGKNKGKGRKALGLPTR